MIEEKTYILKNAKSFELKDIFECGQCFRWNKQQDNSYTGVVKNSVINVKKQGQDVIFKGICKGDFEKLCVDYFDLSTNYENIKNILSNIDDNLKTSINYGQGIRILRQDLWECLISFIISANNNIPRIKKIIEKLSMLYGKKIEYNNKVYYAFPTPEELSVATVEDLRNAGLGFRDKRVYDTCKMVKDKVIDLDKLAENNTQKAKEELLKFPGVGEKVADCILLFSLRRFEVFPIDVWVRRVMNELYIKCEDETKVDKKEILKLAQEKYKDMAGLAQQYLFYWKREA